LPTGGFSYQNKKQRFQELEALPAYVTMD